MKLLPGGISLQTALVSLFAVVTILAVGLVGMLSFYSGRQAVNDVSLQLRVEIVGRINEHVQEFLAFPQMINLSNARAIGQETGAAVDQQALVARFAEQVDLFPMVTSINYGNALGGLANSGREPLDDSRYVIITDGFQAGTFRKIALDSEVRQGRELAVRSDFDARTRPWYAHAQAQGGPVFSDIYIIFTGQDMSLAASRPVYDKDGTFLGVVSVDLFLSHLSRFLQEQRIGTTGQAFIMERSGKLVACSKSRVLMVDDDPALSRRVRGVESDDPVVREAVQALTSRFEDLDALEGGHFLDFEIHGQKHLLQVSSLQVNPGIDWLVVVSMPESDFMAGIAAQNRNTILLTLGVLVLALLIGVLVARGIIRPISLLDGASRKLTSGSHPEEIDEITCFVEVRNLTRSFNLMSRKLFGSIQMLNNELAERKRAEEALLESEEMQRKLLQTVPDLIIRTDLESTITFVNEMAFPGLENLPEASISGKNIFSFIAEHDRPRAMEDAWARLEKNIGPQEYQLQFNNSVIDAEVNGAVILDKDSRPAGMVYVIRDITERRHAEQERERLQAQLLQAQKMESIGILAGGVAHDFNNLLHAMRGHIELLLQSKTEDHPDARRLQNVTKSIDRGTQLVRQLLLFGRKAGSRRVRVDLNQEVEGMGRMLERTIPRMVALELRLDHSVWPLFADPVQIEQVLLNLAGNAADAMPEGGRLVLETGNMVLDAEFVRLHPGSTAGPHVLLTVTDTGCGMGKEVLDHIFDPFFTTKEVGKGTGLGLSTVYGIVKAHGGYIQCFSEPGLGTTFKVFWPAVQGNENLAEERSRETFPDGGSETVLVVDDDVQIRELTQEALEMLGYSVRMAANGEQALKIFQEHESSIDLVLLDLNMPGMGGYRCLEELLRLDPNVKVVIASGYKANGHGKNALNSGAKGFLGKPHQLKELAAMVRKVLDEKE
jgi:PAS domain S-box-containing protein